MKKLANYWDKYVLKSIVIFLMVFIPLYPKLPLLDIVQTWVYIRIEDFLVAFVVALFAIQLVRRKTSVASPLSVPIAVYWLVGGISLVFAIFVLAPQMPFFYPHLGLLHFARRIEYMVLFFIALGSVRNHKDIHHYVVVFLTMLAGVIVYGYGQKYLGFPAFLTMNEEFAKGIPLQLGPDSRINSTFAGHYDLAAFLVFALALLTSLFFGFKKIGAKLLLVVLFINSTVLLLFTASRISFIVYLLVIPFMLSFMGKKKLIIPLIGMSLVVMVLLSGTSSRFEKTFRMVPVVYDIQTGKPIATFEDFKIHQASSAASLVKPVVQQLGTVIPIAAITPIVEPTPTPYEELPLGSGFLNVPFTKKELLTLNNQTYLVKHVIVYDISFTTRFQGTWPRAIEAFKRNILLGSGFSSISLASDNDYLRMLGETGLAGFVSFMAILLIFFIMVKQLVRELADPLSRAFVVGVASGVLAICINAALIDIFEASKIAYLLWIMVGLVSGLYMVTIPRKESIMTDLYALLRRPVVALMALVAVALFLFSDAIGSYFVADDFTWLRWASQAQISDIGGFFTDAKGFFFRPFTKLLTMFFYTFMGLSASSYHVVSIMVHLASSMLVYGIARYIIKKPAAALAAAVLFLIHPIHAEVVLWMSGYSGLFAAFFFLAAFYSFIIQFHRQQSAVKFVLLVCSVIAYGISLLFYELVISFPLMVVFYSMVYGSKETVVRGFKRGIVQSLPFVGVTIGYGILRNVVARAHFLSGDYNYNWLYFPLNAIGNSIGYMGQLATGDRFIAIYDLMRLQLREQKAISVIVGIILVGSVILLIQQMKKRHVGIAPSLTFSMGWFVITLLPVLGLGNIAERYAYLPSVAYSLVVGIGCAYMLRVAAAFRGRMVTILVYGLTIGVLAFYWGEMNRVKETWQQAGETSHTIMNTISTTYTRFPANSSLYILNAPIRIERAWVFPVGLDDALWFAYKDPTLHVFAKSTRQDALSAKQTGGASVFIFAYENNTLKEVK